MEKHFSNSGVWIIAEMAQSHDGSLGMAHAFVDAVADRGATAVKFQMHIAAEESSPQEPWRVKFSRQDDSRYDYWERMEFTPEQWRGLKKHTEDRGLIFICSPFSLKAAALLNEMDIAVWKIASGEVHDPFLMEYLLKTKKPLILSTGLCTVHELDEVIKKTRRRRCEFAVMQCTTEYPCRPEKVGLNMLDYFRNRYRCPVGLSDHSGKIFPGLSAAVLGAKLVEVHVAFHRGMFGPDVSSSIVMEELQDLVEGIRFIEVMGSKPVDKTYLGRSTQKLRAVFGKSLFAARDLPAGQHLSKKDVVLKKPGTGLPASSLPQISGKKVVRKIASGTMLSKDHFC